MTLFHRWRLKRWSLVVLPVLLFLLLFQVGSSRYIDDQGTRVFLSDDAYRTLAVADGLRTHFSYRITADEPIPARNDVLWHALTAMVSRVLQDGTSAVLLLGLVFGVLTLRRLTVLSGQLFPFPLYSFLVAALLLLSPTLIQASLAGESTILAMWLIVSALVFHLEELAKTGRGLPLRATIFIGLAVWLRIEFLIVWFVLWLHSMIAVFIPARNKPYFGGVFFRGISHLFVLALFLLPVFLWNMHVLKVPWPRWPDTPLAADIWQIAGPEVAFSAMMDAVIIGWQMAYSAVWGTLVPARLWPSIFFLLGFVILIRDMIKTKELRPFLLFILIPLLLPFVYGLFFPYVGADSFTIVFDVFWFIGWLLSAYGAVRLPYLCEGWLRAGSLPVSAENGMRAAWAMAAVLLLLSATLANTSQSRRTAVALDLALIERAEIIDMVQRHGLHRDSFLTDRAGWLFWDQGLQAMDLRGEWSPRLLPYVAQNGLYDVNRLEEYLESLTPPPGVMVIWNEQYHELAEMLPEKRIIIPVYEKGHVLMVMGTWPGVF